MLDLRHIFECCIKAAEARLDAREGVLEKISDPQHIEIVRIGSQFIAMRGSTEPPPREQGKYFSTVSQVLEKLGQEVDAAGKSSADVIIAPNVNARAKLIRKFGFTAATFLRTKLCTT